MLQSLLLWNNVCGTGYITVWRRCGHYPEKEWCCGCRFFCVANIELIPDCKSLADIRISAFKVKAITSTKRGVSGTDSKVSIDLSVVNGYGKRVFFSGEGRSLVGVSIAVVVRCVEKFLNAELSFLVMKKALTEAYERNRQDLVERYKIILSSVVKYTPYTL